MKKEKPVALMFDVFGTVVNWRGSLIKQLQKTRLFDKNEIDVPAFVDSWRALYQPSMEQVRSGKRGWEILDTLHQESLQELVRSYQIGPVDQGTIRELSLFWHRLDPWEDSVAGLSKLKVHFTISTLSNGNTALLVNMAKFAGLPWDVILGAETAGAYKPLPHAYLNNIRLLGLEPSQTMLVAAHNDDLQAAKSVGMKTAFVARPLEYGPNQTIDLEPAENWDLIAGDFDDLAELLIP